MGTLKIVSEYEQTGTEDLKKLGFDVNYIKSVNFSDPYDDGECDTHQIQEYFVYEDDELKIILKINFSRPYMKLNWITKGIGLYYTNKLDSKKSFSDDVFELKKCLESLHRNGLVALLNGKEYKKIKRRLWF